MEEKQDDRAKIILMLQGSVMEQLLQFDKFKVFIATHYEILPKIDDEGKEIGMQVREYSQEEQVNLLKKELEEIKKNETLIMAKPEDLNKLPKIDFPRRGYKRRK